ncbi:MAG: hypothetical protein ACK4MF_11605 [Hyphomicrobiaceae bacterium]
MSTIFPKPNGAGWRVMAAAFIGAGAFLVAATMAEAGRLGISRDYGYDGIEEGYVVARSRFGNGTVSGPVRETRVGPQVRLPGGTWEYCRRSCSETLRVETVDIWEARQGMGAECGILGCLSIGIGR